MQFQRTERQLAADASSFTSEEKVEVLSAVRAAEKRKTKQPILGFTKGSKVQRTHSDFAPFYNFWRRERSERAFHTGTKRIVQFSVSPYSSQDSPGQTGPAWRPVLYPYPRRSTGRRGRTRPGPGASLAATSWERWVLENNATGCWLASVITALTTRTDVNAHTCAPRRALGGGACPERRAAASCRGSPRCR